MTQPEHDTAALAHMLRDEQAAHEAATFQLINARAELTFNRVNSLFITKLAQSDPDHPWLNTTAAKDLIALTAERSAWQALATQRQTETEAALARLAQIRELIDSAEFFLPPVTFAELAALLKEPDVD